MAERVETSFPGTTRWEYVRKLGEGGMGAVFLVFDRDLKANVALKVLPKVEASSLYRFKREFRSLAEIDHPHLISLYELIAEDDEWFFTMEYIEGVDFLTYVRRGTGYQEPGSNSDTDKSTILLSDADSTRLQPTKSAGASSQPGARAFDIDLSLTCEAFRQLAEGIHAVHLAGMLHRDIKPNNVLVRSDGTVVLLDFGLITPMAESQEVPDASSPDVPPTVRKRGSSNRSMAGNIVGTFRYMAPEQAAGQPLTEACDWYAMGVMLFATLTGELPFGSDTTETMWRKLTEEAPRPSELNPSAPAVLDELCTALLQRDPQKRPRYEEIISRIAGPEVGKGRGAGLNFGRQSKFIGREAELNQLHAAYRRSLQGDLVTAVVTGRSGVGKSKLIEEFLEATLADSPAVVLTGRCFEQESVPFKALDSLVDALCRHLQSLEEPELERLLPRNVGAVARLFPVLNQIPAIARENTQRLSELSPHELRRLGFRACNELIARIGDRQPLILYVDDIHWGDRDSVDALQELCENQSGLRAMLILSYREEHALLPEYAQFLKELESGLSSGKHVHLYIAPFDEKHARSIVQHYLGSTVRPDQIERIVSHARGNPLFVQEMSLQYAHMIRRGESPQEIDLADVLNRRVSVLDEQSRSVLELLSIAGKPTKIQDILNSIPELKEPQRVISSLRRNHHIRGTGVHLHDLIMVFHDQIRESICAGLSPERKQSCHAHLAATIARHPDVDFESLAVHQEGAQDFRSAGESYFFAGRKSAAALAFEHSVTLFRRAFELHPGFDDREHAYRIEFAEALANAGQGFESANQYLKVAERSPDGNRRQLLESAATQYCVSGHSDAGRKLFGTILQDYGVKLRTHPVAVISSLLWQRFRLRMRGLKYTLRDPADVDPQLIEQIDHLWDAASGMSFPEPVVTASLQTRGLLLALKSGDPTRLIRSISWEAALNATTGPKGRAHTEKLLSIAGSLADLLKTPYAMGMLRLGQGTAAFLHVRMQDAIDFLTEAEEKFSNGPVKAWWELASARALIVWSYMHMGNFVAMRKYTNEYLKDAETRGDRFVLANLGGAGKPQLHLANDAPETADNQIQEIIGQYPYVRFQQHHVSLLYSQTQIDLYRGQGLRSWNRFRDNWGRLKASMQLFNQLTRVSMLELRARAALCAVLRENQPSMLKFVLRDASTLRTETGDWVVPVVQRIEAGVAEAQGQTELAMATLAKAGNNFDGIGFHMAASACRWRQGDLAGGTEGAALKQQAELAMAEQHVINPERMQASLLY